MTHPTSKPRRADASRRTIRVLLVVVAALLLAYAAQIAAPTRMMNDTVSYFLRAHQFLEGGGLASNHKRVEHPVGYSIVLAGMIHMGMDNLRWFLGLNFACLCVTLVLTVPICRAVFGLSRLALACCILFFLLSWVLVKHAPMLYTELLYGAISFVILWLLMCVKPTRFWARAGVFLLAVGLTVALVSVRTIGLAMLPAIGWSVVQQCGGWGALYGRAMRDARSKAVSAALLGLLVAGVAYKATTYDPDSGSRYVRIMVQKYTEKPIETGLKTLDYRVQEFGKLAVNAPERALRMVLPGEWWRVPVYAAGVCVIPLLLVGLWQQRRRLTPVHAYLLGYLVLQLPWLSFDARFWLPVVPLLLPIVLEPIRLIHARFPKPVRIVGVGYGMGYGAVGVVALGIGLYYTAIGRDYAEHDIWFGNELRVAYGLAEAEDFEILDHDAVNLIRRYDPHTPTHLRLTGVPKPSPIPYEQDPAKREERAR